MPARRPTRAADALVTVSFTSGGRRHEVEVDVPGTADPEAVRDEVTHFVQTLADNGQLDGPEAAYEIVPSPSGTGRLRRVRAQR